MCVYLFLFGKQGILGETMKCQEILRETLKCLKCCSSNAVAILLFSSYSTFVTSCFKLLQDCTEC